MRADLKAKWVAALRSGKYEQGTGWLNRNGKFCCLGVLCEVAEVPTDVNHRAEHGFTSYVFRDPDLIGACMIYGDVAQALGVDPTILTEMNDDRGLSFNAIADWIEANVPVDEVQS